MSQKVTETLNLSTTNFDLGIVELIALFEHVKGGIREPSSYLSEIIKMANRGESGALKYLKKVLNGSAGEQTKRAVYCCLKSLDHSLIEEREFSRIQAALSRFEKDPRNKSAVRMFIGLSSLRNEAA
ncbi:MAG TPA: hypothetical protein PKA31_02840 [Candidatus Moranbacteria bacterium]|nr:hypothetical protein [Candidatus Moranbacteria bacterium]